LDALTYAGHIGNLPVDLNECNQNERVTFWYGNVRNGELVDTLVSQSDVVVHFAAETHVTRSIYDNFLFFETDVLGTQTVANAILKYKDRIERFIHISTSEVYGTARKELMDEDHPLMPMSPYASAKAGADRLVYSYWATYELPVTIVRPFNNYGPYQHLEKAIPRFITSCILDEPIRVHGDGCASRDYVFVEDVCGAIDMIMHADIEKVSGEVFNVATGAHRSILSIAQDIVRMMKKSESLLTFAGERPGQVFRHTGDINKIKNTFGWEPKITWEEGLNRSVQWYKENRTWWENQLWMKAVPIITKSGKKELH
jgi:dTDP-glucose 4,6-dehydratase